MHAKRKQQLIATANALKPYSSALIVGDFNFDNPDENATVQEIGLTDTWPLLRPDEPGYTEGKALSQLTDKDTILNPMRLQHTKHNKRVRFDRLLFRGELTPVEARLVGTSQIDQTADGLAVFPSDHFGLVVTLSQ